MSKTERKMAAAPKLSLGKIIKHNWFLLKIVFSASPLGVLLHGLEQFRVNAFIFVEHTLIIRMVLECIEYGKPFREALIPILILTVVLAATGYLGSIVGQWLIWKTFTKAKAKMKTMLYEKACKVDISCFDDPAYYNDFIATSDKIDELIRYIHDIVGVLGGALGTIVTTGVFFAIESTPVFFLIVLSTACHLFLIIRRNKMSYSRYVTARRYSRKIDYIKRLFYFRDYAKELRLNSDVKDKAFEDHDSSYDELVESNKFHNKKIVASQILGLTIETLLLDVIPVLILSYQASVLQLISYSTVIVMINATYRLRRAFTNFIYKIATSAENCMYVEKFRKFLELEPGIISEKKLPVDNEPCSIELRNVSFKYSEGGDYVIRNVSLKLDAREKLALVGYNGAGKTTLIKLIMRLYDPTEGAIYMNGVDIREYDVEAYRHHIGVVFQDFNLYAVTIAENVVMGEADNAPGEKIIEALRHSGFEDRLETMENGIDTVITKEFDDNGAILSGGESQKIAIARAFYKNSGLIILDEPSSALDPIAEYNFNRYMAEAAENCTVIFISHRLSTTRLADRIIMLENGSVCEEGTHEELLAANGKYAEMWHTQADKYIS